jgi:toxin-antitoxin system PIN domain toxin
VTPDVNVLVAASRRDHPHHRVALSWLENALDDGAGPAVLVVLPMVATGFLRLVTHPRVFVEPTPLDAAQSFIRTILESPGVQMLPLGPEWPIFESLCARHQLVGNDIPDAWIAAAALAHHVPLATFDRGFRRFLESGQLVLLEAG